MTRVAVAAAYWSTHHPDFSLTDTRLSYDLARTPSKVIPDAWLLIENTQGDQYSLMLEIDRGMEFQAKFKRHVKARIDYICSGEYARTFGIPAVIVAYATTGQRPEYREARRATMTAWTQDVLEELGGQSWARIFRFTSLVLEEVYAQGIFDHPVWYRPDTTSPVPLLTP